MLTYRDHPELARQSIESIRTHCSRSEYQLVIGANAVSGETRTYLESLRAAGAVDHLIDTRLVKASLRWKSQRNAGAFANSSHSSFRLPWRKPAAVRKHSSLHSQLASPTMARPGPVATPGLRSYREFIPDVVDLAGLRGTPSFVLNDAELAAFTARADPRLAQYRKVLVLTLGFGIGAALICRSR